MDPYTMILILGAPNKGALICGTTHIDVVTTLQLWRLQEPPGGALANNLLWRYKYLTSTSYLGFLKGTWPTVLFLGGKSSKGI